MGAHEDIAMRSAGFALRHGFRITLAALVAVASQPFAQEPKQGVAQLRDVAGNVLVSRESGLAAGSEALRLIPGVRVITTSKSSAVVVYDDGCEVKLKENERFEVESGKPCATLVAMPQSILSTPAGSAAATAAGSAAIFAVALPALGGAAASILALRSLRESQPVSPS
jgi:hypothetical protein